MNGGKNVHKIDFLVSQGGQGGVENVVNRTGVYLQEHGWLVRILQFADTNYNWTDERLEWRSFWPHDKKIEFDPTIDMIEDYYRQHGAPDIVIATTWPMLNVVAAIVRNELRVSYRIGSWMHATLEEYDTKGWGGARELSAADFHLAINLQLTAAIRSGLPKAEIYQVKNPIELTRICYCAHRDPKRFCTVSRLDEEKNVAQVIEAFAGLPEDTQLSVVGMGDEYDKLVALADSCGVSDRVVFYGWKENPWQVLEQAGTMVLACDNEVAPLVVVEALLSGMAVLASRTGDVPERITDGMNGWTFDNYDFERMGMIMKGLASGELSLPPAEQCAASAKGFTEDRPLLELAEIFEKECGSL